MARFYGDRNPTADRSRSSSKRAFPLWPVPSFYRVFFYRSPFVPTWRRSSTRDFYFVSIFQLGEFVFCFVFNGGLVPRNDAIVVADVLIYFFVAYFCSDRGGYRRHRCAILRSRLFVASFCFIFSATFSSPSSPADCLATAKPPMGWSILIRPLTTRVPQKNELLNKKLNSNGPLQFPWLLFDEIAAVVAFHFT